jgi:hypothetical protein
MNSHFKSVDLQPGIASLCEFITQVSGSLTRKCISVWNSWFGCVNLQPAIASLCEFMIWVHRSPTRNSAAPIKKEGVRDKRHTTSSVNKTVISTWSDTASLKLLRWDQELMHLFLLLLQWHSGLPLASIGSQEIYPHHRVGPPANSPSKDWRGKNINPNPHVSCIWKIAIPLHSTTFESIN